MTLRILRDTEALHVLRDAGFRDSWRKLHEACPWSTPFQSPGFVQAWYEAYEAAYSPLILAEFSTLGELLGLFTLAIRKDSGRLVVAGAQHAEYQVWLAVAKNGVSFFEKAVETLRAEFSNQSVVLKYLPPGAPRISADPNSNTWLLKLEPRVRPFVKLAGNGATIDFLQQRRKKWRKKGNLSRLEQFGEIYFQRIDGYAELCPILDDLVTYYDLRQGAIHGELPFGGDPSKRTFHQALLQVPGLHHVDILKVGQRIAAASFALCHAGTAHLILNIVSPLVARASPFTLHLLMLLEQLNQEGFSACDLTPGGDEWKEQFATDHDEVSILTVFLRRSHWIRSEFAAKAQGLGKRGLVAFRISPKSVKAFAEKLQRFRWKHLAATLARKLFNWVRRFWSTVELRVYSFKAEDPPCLVCPNQILRDKLQDLLAFRPVEVWQTRQAFLTEALKHLEKGDHPYTHVEDACLLHYGWLVERQEKTFFVEVGQEFRFPEGSAVLCEFYTAPAARGRGLYQSSLRQMIHDAAAIPGTKRAYIAVLADNGPSRRAIEKVGFIYDCSLFQTRRFGRIRRWSNKGNTSDRLKSVSS